MQLPTYEKQNSWIMDYIYPIVDGFNVAEVVRNFMTRKRNALHRDMEDAGVFKSLERLETEGTGWDGVLRDFRDRTRKVTHRLYSLRDSKTYDLLEDLLNQRPINSLIKVARKPEAMLDRYNYGVNENENFTKISLKRRRKRDY